MKKGFTLVEVLIVVVILGVLATIAIPQYNKVVEKSRSAEALNNLGALRSSMERYWYEKVAEGGYDAADRIVNFTMGAEGDIKLDIDNPNLPDSDPNKRWEYGLADLGTTIAPDFVIEAQRFGKETTHWIQIKNTGEIRKSTPLGGFGTKFPGYII